MAFPVVLVNSSTGSDSLASGAGPSTALTGTAAATDATGLIVTLDAGTVLTGVLTDGSHVLYFNHTTGRNFGKITATAGSGGATPTVTVSDAFTASLSGKSWAIGGKRASIGSTSSGKLLTTPDLLAGWAMEMQSGHAETIAATVSVACTGTLADGPCILRGEFGAATMPLLTFSNNGNAINIGNGKNAIVFRDFEMRNTNATKTASVAIANGGGSSNDIRIRNVKIAHSTNFFWKAIRAISANTFLEECEIGYCAGMGLDIQALCAIRTNWIHNCGSYGIAMSANVAGSTIENNVIAGNGDDGINDQRSGTSLTNGGLYLCHNTIDSNAGDGYECTMTSATTFMAGTIIENNIFSNNGGYGLNFSSTGGTDAQLNYLAVRIRNNNTYLNTSGPIFPTTLTIATDDPGLNPTYANAAGGDYSIGTNLKAKGYPLAGSLTIGATSSTYSYKDIGAAQRQESGGTGSSVRAPIRANSWHHIG